MLLILHEKIFLYKWWHSFSALVRKKLEYTPPVGAWLEKLQHLDTNPIQMCSSDDSGDGMGGFLPQATSVFKRQIEENMYIYKYKSSVCMVGEAIFFLIFNTPDVGVYGR